MVLRKIVVLSKSTEIQQLARSVGCDVFVADDLVEAVDIISTVNPHFIILDSRVQIENIGLFGKFPVLIVGANAADSKAQSDNIFYLPDATDVERLRQIINEIATRDSGLVTLKTSDEFFAEEIAASVSMAGKSKATLATLKMIRLVAESQCNPVLIIGETGTGKELAAKAVHNIRHPDEPFVAVNCAALTANLLESELFGHSRGSFTGADREKTGLLELAGAGTIFLDEISEMPLDLQAKLLRVLQEKTFRKVGGVTDLTCKATIIASSNRDLRKAVAEKHLRQDLYYRLNICPVTIAPLRSADRRDDIRMLAKYFLKTSTVCPAKAGKITSFTEMALERIEQHNWPGNIRELRNVVERAILLETTGKIGLSSVVIDNDPSLVSRDSSLENNESRVPSHESPNRDFSLDKAERELIARALQESGWQKTKAASLLGITRATLYAKVKQHNIQKGTYIPATPEEAGLVPV